MSDWPIRQLLERQTVAKESQLTTANAGTTHKSTTTPWSYAVLIGASNIVCGITNSLMSNATGLTSGTTLGSGVVLGGRITAFRIRKGAAILIR
jgi:hypothetical protein